MNAPYYKERPILYSTDMVIARNEGRKTQTRRTLGLEEINENPSHWEIQSIDTSKPLMQATFGHVMDPEERRIINCKYGKPGDHLYVRETFALGRSSGIVFYKAGHDYKLGACFDKWIPSIHMPRKISRGLDLIENIRIERLLEITVPECEEEGAAGGHDSIPDYPYSATPYEHYQHIWESINGTGSWFKNPWVWVIEFEVVKS